jgi:hypothetical protein|tara:strand:+ start:682 stop:1146 length:465 start_codon:yes stop_codon:yes gene_type:complete
MTAMLTDLASWLLVAAGATLSTLSLRQLESSWRDLRRLRAHRRVARSAIQKSRMDLLEVRNRAKLLEDTVASGTQAVEKVHQAISSTTFGLIDLLSRDDATRASARRARRNHDRKRRDLYQAVRTTNRALHVLAETLILDRAEKRVIEKRKKAP